MKAKSNPAPAVPQEIIDSRDMFFAAHKLFYKTFRRYFTDFMDKDLTAAFRKPVLDIGKFDDWLHEKFGEYENDGLSMSDVLANNFGESAAMQVKGLLG